MAAIDCTVSSEASALQTDASWTPVAALGIAAFVMVTTEFMPVGLIPSIAESLGQTEGRTGLMVTLPGLFAALSAPAIIYFARSLDRRTVLAGLLGLLAVSNLVVFLSSTFEFVLAGRALMGIAVGGFWTIGGSLGPRLQPARAAKAGAIILSGVSLGMVAGMPAGAMLGGMFGWRWAFGMAGLVAIIVLALMLAVMPSLPSRNTNGLRDVPLLLRIPKVRLGLYVMLGTFGAHFLAYTFVTPFLIQISGIQSSIVSLILLAFGIAAFLGNLLGGWAASKTLRGAMLTTALMLAVPTLLLATAGQNSLFAFVLLMVWGVAFGMQAISIQSWLFNSAPKQVEAVQATFVSLAQVAIGSGALVGGLLVDGLGVASTMWTTTLIAFATAALFAICAWRPSASH